MKNGLVKESGNPPAVARAWPLWLAAAGAVLVALGGETARRALRYERVAVLDGEWWRLLSGQFAHLGVSHLLLNLAGLAAIGWVFGPGLRAAHWLALLGASWLAICAGFLLLEPQLGWYVGLSGVLHGLLLGAAVLDRGLPSGLRAGLVAITLAKLVWEQWAGALPFTAQAAGGPVVVAAHWYGGLGGLAAGIVWRLVERRPSPV